MSVQQTIVKGIKELLFHHNYLVLPGFGGFVLKAGPSHFSATGLSLHPPFKTVSFNARLKQNDSILALWLQEQLQCQPSESLEHLRDFSDYCQAVLTTRRRLNMDGIGFFYLDFENNISFEPQTDVNFLTESFGLGTVQIKPLEPVPSEEKEQKIFKDRVIVAPEIRETVRTKRNYQRVLVPIALLGLLFSLLALFVANTKISGQLRASVMGAENHGLYEPIVYPDLHLVIPARDNSAYVVDANGIATVEVGEKVIPVKALSYPVDASETIRHNKYGKSFSGKFEIVLGCFAVPENATKMADKISRKHIDVRVSSRNEKGMYVVSTGSFSSKEEAIAGLSSIKPDYPKAWIK